MPVLSTFFGITIRMYFADHAPPHFHVQYAEFQAVVEIGSGRVLAGQLPGRCTALVEEWRRLRIAELAAAWEAAHASRAPQRIDPLS